MSTWWGILSLQTIVGNSLVLWLIAKNKSLRTNANLFITSLAVADLLVGLIIAPVWIIFRCSQSNKDKYEHKYAFSIDYLWIHTTVATTFNLCCVTLDRHIAIFHPLRYQSFLTKKRCYGAIALVWLMSVVLPCSRFIVMKSSAMVLLWMSFMVVTVLIPVMIITFSSILILKAAARQCKKFIIANNFCQDLEAIKRSKKNYKVTKTVCIVVGLFLVCWLPCLVTSFVNYCTHCGLFCYYNTVWIYVELTAFSSSGINPWVYCLRHKEFYKALTATFRPRRRQISLDQNRFHQTKSGVQQQRWLLIRLIRSLRAPNSSRSGLSWQHFIPYYAVGHVRVTRWLNVHWL